MRPIPMLTLVAALALASAATAQTRQPIPAPVAPATDETPLPSIEEGRAAAAAMTAELAEYDARIRADEVRLTELRDAALQKSNARIRAIKPALPLHGTTWFQLWP